MGNTKHTQGKWEANQNKGSYSIWSKNTDGNYPLVAVVKFDAHKFTSNTILIEEAEANAKLIASTPDMLEMLIRIEESLDFQYDPELHKTLSDLIKQATL